MIHEFFFSAINGSETTKRNPPFSVNTENATKKKKRNIQMSAVRPRTMHYKGKRAKRHGKEVVLYKPVEPSSVRAKK